MNVLQLAPGGHIGRFVIWTRDAFEKLDALYGTYNKVSQLKKDYRLPRPLMANPDLNRIIDSEEIQSAIRPARETKSVEIKKKNALVNVAARNALNPYYPTLVRNRKNQQKAVAKKKAALVEQKRTGKAPKKDSKTVARNKAFNTRINKQRKDFTAFVSK